jgi:hypothetical protein
MLHPELQKLLEYALQDGELSEKERELLHKKATELGQDIDVLELVIEGELQKINKQNTDEKQTNFSCPNCGSSIPKSSIKCNFCDFEITRNKVTGLDYINQLALSLTRLDNEHASQSHSINAWGATTGDPRGLMLAQKKADALSTFIFVIAMPTLILTRHTKKLVSKIY